MAETINFSAIVPVGSRCDRTGDLVAEYYRELKSVGLKFEMICVIDGEQPEVTQRLLKFAENAPGVRIIQLAREFGESTAITAGLEYSTGEVVLTLPAYYQVKPSECRKLVDAIESCDIAVGARWPRSTTGWFETFRRNAFHWLVRLVTQETFNDLGCGARAIRRIVLDDLPLYGDQHRFLPVLAARRGFRVSEIKVEQSQLDRYEDGYGMRVYLRRILDIFAMFFLVRFTKKPLRFFGTIGSVTFFVGAIILSLVIGEKIFLAKALADRPAMLLSSLLVVLGLQLFALGLLGELIIFAHARSVKEYSVEKIVNEER